MAYAEPPVVIAPCFEISGRCRSINVAVHGCDHVRSKVFMYHHPSIEASVRQSACIGPLARPGVLAPIAARHCSTLLETLTSFPARCACSASPSTGPLLRPLALLKMHVLFDPSIDGSCSIPSGHVPKTTDHKMLKLASVIPRPYC
jgi:hypothetical protein